MVVRRPCLLLAVVVVSVGCRVSAVQDDQPAVTKSAPTVVPAATRPVESPAGQLRTAVRLLTAEPRSVPLSLADVTPDYQIVAENVTGAVQMWHSAERDVSIETVLPGDGYYVLLSRPAGAGQDGVVSVATSAVRYTTTLLAHRSFNVQTAIVGDGGLTSVDDGGLADELRSWRSQSAVVVVEQVLARRHNYLLSLTLVRVPGVPTSDVARKFTLLLEAKLSE